MKTLKILMSREVFVSLVMNRRGKNSSLTFSKVDIYARDSEAEGTRAERSQRAPAAVFIDHSDWALLGADDD